MCAWYALSHGEGGTLRPPLPGAALASGVPALLAVLLGALPRCGPPITRTLPLCRPLR